jgi:hypothetical protein
MIYIQRFIKIDSGIQKLIKEIHKQTRTQTGKCSHKLTFIFFKIRIVSYFDTHAEHTYTV